MVALVGLIVLFVMAWCTFLWGAYLVIDLVHGHWRSAGRQARHLALLWTAWVVLLLAMVPFRAMP